MIQLREEGWIHHLARHAVACFLTRGDLWISWEEGMKARRATFLSTLVSFHLEFNFKNSNNYLSFRCFSYANAPQYTVPVLLHCSQSLQYGIVPRNLNIATPRECESFRCLIINPFVCGLCDPV